MVTKHVPGSARPTLACSRSWWSESAHRTQVRGEAPPSEGESSPAIRSELVARVRKEIAEGTYETPEKLEKALGRLLDELA
jgi:hypothetical protein